MTAAAHRRTTAPARADRVPAPGLHGPLNPPFDDYRGRRVWVIGASYGIGAAIALDLLGRGARVALSARKRDLLQAVAGGHGEAFIAPLDVTDPASVHAAAGRIVAAWGGFDLALVVAGTHEEMRARAGREGGVAGDEAAWNLDAARRLLEVNLHGVLNCVYAVLPVLTRQGSGGIGIVSSVAGYVGLPGAMIYGASKAALINFTESLYGHQNPQYSNRFYSSPIYILQAGLLFHMGITCRRKENEQDVCCQHRQALN